MNCQFCAHNSYSLGGNIVTCDNSVCTSNQFNPTAGATTDTEGCVSSCSNSQIKIKNKFNDFVCE